MSFITRGFSGRSRERDPRLPPGQTLVEDLPVLSAGPTPRSTPPSGSSRSAPRTAPTHLELGRVQALGLEDITTDIHCVTHWTKLDMPWRGVSLDTLFENVETEHDYVMAHSYGGYTTNVPLEDLLDGKAWIAFESDGEPLDPEHGGPARLLVPHLYFWKSAKWVRGLDDDADR